MKKFVLLLFMCLGINLAYSGALDHVPTTEKSYVNDGNLSAVDFDCFTTPVATIVITNHFITNDVIVVTVIKTDVLINSDAQKPRYFNVKNLSYSHYTKRNLKALDSKLLLRQDKRLKGTLNKTYPPETTG